MIPSNPICLDNKSDLFHQTKETYCINALFRVLTYQLADTFAQVKTRNAGRVCLSVLQLNDFSRWWIHLSLTLEGGYGCGTWLRGWLMLRRTSRNSTNCSTRHCWRERQSRRELNMARSDRRCFSASTAKQFHFCSNRCNCTCNVATVKRKGRWNMMKCQNMTCDVSVCVAVVLLVWRENTQTASRWGLWIQTWRLVTLWRKRSRAALPSAAPVSFCSSPQSWRCS